MATKVVVFLNNKIFLCEEVVKIWVQEAIFTIFGV